MVRFPQVSIDREKIVAWGKRVFLLGLLAFYLFLKRVL